jgi:single-stranded DNA-specific DHH superfamily exonuclease
MTDVNHLLGTASVLGASIVGTVLLIVAQASAPGDILSGAPAWTGTGLLGAILAWLFFRHLPAKDKQISDLVETRDRMVRELTADHRANIVELTASHRASLADLATRAVAQDQERRKDFREALDVVVSHCERETATNSKAIAINGEAIRKTVGDLTPIIEEWWAERRRERGGARGDK